MVEVVAVTKNHVSYPDRLIAGTGNLSKNPKKNYPANVPMPMEFLNTRTPMSAGNTTIVARVLSMK